MNPIKKYFADQFLLRLFFPFFFFKDKFNLLSYRELSFYTPPVTMERINECLKTKNELEQWRRFFKDKNGFTAFLGLIFVLLCSLIVITAKIAPGFPFQPAVEALLFYTFISMLSFAVWNKRIKKAELLFDIDFSEFYKSDCEVDASYFDDWFLEEIFHADKYEKVLELAEKHSGIKDYLLALDGRLLLSTEFNEILRAAFSKDQLSTRRELRTKNNERGRSLGISFKSRVTEPTT